MQTITLHDITKYLMFDVSVSYSPACEGGVACVGGGGGGGGGVSAVSGLGGCTAELVPSPQSAPGLPPTCYLIVTVIHSTSPISGFRLMNVGTFL